MPGLPDKQYFRIGEVADLVGVKPSVLRYWETEFRTVRPEKSKTGQRLYSRANVERLQMIKELLYAQGFTIAGARKKLAGGKVELPPPPAPTGPSRAVLDEIALEARELLQLVGE